MKFFDLFRDGWFKRKLVEYRKKYIVYYRKFVALNEK